MFSKLQNFQPQKSLHSFWIINRFEALFAYNIGYFLILFSLPGAASWVRSEWEMAIALFVAILLMKAQASIADALHDYDYDKNNPQKSYVSDTVDQIGRDNANTLLALELVGSLGLWGYLAAETGSIVFVIAGVVSCLFGYTYSYPPRFKERGVFNHVVTSGVDVTCVLLPGALLFTGSVSIQLLPMFVLVFLYSFVYHVLHQAGDTYYDRRDGLDTFTQNIGVDGSLAFSTILLVTALTVALAVGYLLMAVPLAVFAGYFAVIYRRVRSQDEQAQSDIVSEKFKISRCATVFNFTLAAQLFIGPLL